MKRIFLLLLFTFTIFSLSCTRIAEDENTESPKSTTSETGKAVINIHEILKSTSPLKILVVYENTGTIVANNFSLTIRPRKGGTALASYTVTTNPTVSPNIKIWTEIPLTGLTSHDDYDDFSFHFSWTEPKTGTIEVAKLIR